MACLPRTAVLATTLLYLCRTQQHRQFVNSKAFCAIVRPGEAPEGDLVPQGSGTCASADCGGQLLSCALAFEQLAGPSEVQQHSFASCLQHIDSSLDQLPVLDTPTHTVTISLLTAGVKLPIRKYTVTASTNNVKVG